MNNSKRRLGWKFFWAGSLAAFTVGCTSQNHSQDLLRINRQQAATIQSLNQEIQRLNDEIEQLLKQKEPVNFEGK